jgi:alkylation response protein AidB-like acyl-CoA dehydrogenase
MQAAPAPAPLGFNVAMCGPVIAAFGTDAQKKRFLPRMANLDDWWCQGFSEPGAGSDLAGLKTRAVKEGDHYVVNGQKTWTTLAQHADWIFLLVRTDPNAKKQEGISFLLCDMKSPGITVRPIITIEGGHEVNEVFFDDVKVPLENLVGEENKGWDCAKFLLGNERFGQARVGASRERIRRLKAIASTESVDGGQPLMQDPDFARKVTEIEVELKALEMTVMRVIATESKRKDKKPDPATSVLKIKGTEIQQMCSELLMQAAGPYAWVDGDPEAEGSNDIDVAPDWAFGLAGVYFNWRKQSIYGGSNEIQRNIMAKAFLGL